MLLQRLAAANSAGAQSSGSGPSWLANDAALSSAAPQLQGLAPHQLRSLLAGLRNLVTLNNEHVGLFMAWPLSIR
jgi:hypothetical protein